MTKNLVKVFDSSRDGVKGLDEALQAWDRKVQSHVPAVTEPQSKEAESNGLDEVECTMVCKRIYTLELIDEATENTS